MKKSVQIVATLVLTSLPFCSFAASGREKREIEMAENAIFWSLVVAGSQAGQTACSEDAHACSEDRADLALALLSSKTSPEAVQAFAALLRYPMDAGLSENYSCYVLLKKDPAIKFFLRLKPAAMREKCEHEVLNAARQQPGLLRDVTSGAFCTRAADIEAKRMELIAQLAKHKRCAASDF